MQLSENWARKRRERHGFAPNMGTVLAVDGYVVEIKKPTAADLDGQLKPERFLGFNNSGWL
jgi:hypothetical protein